MWNFYIIPNLRSIQFGLCSICIFFSFFLLFFFCYRYFLWQTLMIHRIAGNGEGIIIFLAFHFHLLRRFKPLLFNRSICNYQIDCWWDLFSFEICILFAFSLMQSSWSYWPSHLKVTLWGFELILNYHPSITKPIDMNTPSHHCLYITPTQPYP